MGVMNNSAHPFFIYRDGRYIRKFNSSYHTRKYLLALARKLRSEYPFRINHDINELTNRHWLGDNPEYLYKYLPDDMVVKHQDKEWKAQDFWSRSAVGI